MLGYDVAPGGGRLVINEKEAVRVREIFELGINLLYIDDIAGLELCGVNSILNGTLRGRWHHGAARGWLRIAQFCHHKNGFRIRVNHWSAGD